MILSKRMLKDKIMASLLCKVLNFDLKTLFKKQPQLAPKPAAQLKKAPACLVDLPTTPFRRDAESEAMISQAILEYDRARGEQAARRRREQDGLGEADRRRRGADDSLMFASMYSSPSQHRSCTSTPVTQDADNDRYSCSAAESPQSAGTDGGSPSESYSSSGE